MASLLGIYRSALRVGVHAGRSCGLALIVAAVLLAGTVEVRAQVVGASNQSVTVGVHQGANSTASVSGSSMAISTNLIADVALAGVSAAAIAIPAVRVLQVGGSVVATAGRMAIRSGMGQAALIALIASLAGDVSLDANGNVVAPQLSVNAGDLGFDGYAWTDGAGVVGSGPLDTCKKSIATNVSWVFDSISQVNSTTYGCYGYVKPATSGHALYSQITRTGNCIAGYVKSGTSCVVDPNGVKVAASDAQIESAISAHSASWPQVFNAANCGKTNSYADAASLDPSDPCTVIITGSVPQSNGVTWPNGNTATFPPRVTNTSGVDAAGNPTTQQQTTATSAQLSGTNSRTTPISATPTTTTTTVTNRTNPDGSTTSTTTTSTTTTPSSDSTDDQAATFNGPDIVLYKAKTKTFADVLTGFRTRVAAMPWYTATVGFFNVTVSTGSCPHWVVPASRWNPSIDGSVYFCSSTAMSLYQLGGVVVMIVAAWAAFRIGLL